MPKLNERVKKWKENLVEKKDHQLHLLKDNLWLEIKQLETFLTSWNLKEGNELTLKMQAKNIIDYLKKNNEKLVFLFKINEFS